MEELLDDIQQEKPRLDKSRHGCATTYLVFMIVANSITSLSIFYRLFISNVGENKLFTILGLIGILNVLFAIFLFNYKRLGFIGFLITSLITFGINISNGTPVLHSLIGLSGIIILYAVLQIKQNDASTWEHLE
jgi:hypothetical protein